MEILTYRLPKFEAEVAKLNKKAVKLGLEPISYVIEKEEIRKIVEINETPEGFIIDKIERQISYTTLKITGTAPKLNGWSIVARVEPATPGTNFVHRSPLVSEEIDLSFLQHKELHCDHCNSKRAKVKAFQIQHDDGRSIMVGGTCLKDFTRATDVTQVLSFLTAMEAFITSDFDDEEGGRISPDAYLFHVGSLIADAHVAIECNGFISRKMQEEQGGMILATADLLACRADVWEKNVELKNPHLTGADLMNRVSEIEAWINAQPGNTDFMHNLKTAVAAKNVKRKMFGIIAAGVNSFLRDLQKRATIQKEGKSNEHFGVVGQRVNLPELKIVHANVIEGVYGFTYRTTFEDEAGNCFVWFASNSVGEVGETFKFKGTIKKHEEYNGRRQTYITRCAVIKEKE